MADFSISAPNSGKEDFRNFAKRMISELHLIPFMPAGYTDKADEAAVSSAAMQKALTVNEELLHAGFTLKPDDIGRLAAGDGTDAFAELIRSCIPSVNADPMYPDFPAQVMKMDEAVFRMHQLLHYFSTYGREMLTGIPVESGWFPQTEKTEKTRADEILLKASVLELVPAEEAPARVLKAVLTKRERMTPPETELVKYALAHINPESLADIRIPFKENIHIVFLCILDAGSAAARVDLCRGICQHTGDILSCIDYLLPRRKYHLKTSEKRMLVKLLESYPVQDFRANLILSRKKGARNIIVLQYLDYNVYSRSEPHKNAVAALRNGELRSWEGQAKCLLSEGSEGALDFIAKRPGMMVRMLRYLLSLGYPEEKLTQMLCDKADRLSMYTVVSALNALDDKEANPPEEFILQRKLTTVDERMFFPYMRRFGRKEEAIHKEYDFKRERQADWLKKIEGRLKWRYLSGMQSSPSAVPLKRKMQLYTEYKEARRKLQVQYEESLQKLDAAEERLVEKAVYFPQNLDAHRKKADREKQRLEKRFEARVRSMEYTDAVRRILLSVMDRNLQGKETELKGRKVYADLTDFVPEMSRIEAGNGSAEGGYIPSGMAYRIPDTARHVRLFVYWNDPERVDVDLHTAGYLPDGTGVHIGWSGDFRNSGMVYSGDITNSDAAEYIDIDLDSDIALVTAFIHLYHGRPSFQKIETCFAGLMAVRALGEDVALYNPANCFFSHELSSDTTYIRYACVDVANRLVYFLGQNMQANRMQTEFSPNRLPIRRPAPTLSLERYLAMLLDSQKAVRAEKPEDADVILTLGKSADEKAVSLVDKRFFLG